MPRRGHRRNPIIVAGCDQAAVITALRERGLWPQRECRQRTPTERREWAAERRDVERDLPTARLWRRKALEMGEADLATLKAALFDPTLPPAE